MDLNTIKTLQRPKGTQDLPSSWPERTMWLAGGTWIYSEPQEDLDCLVDLGALGWDEAEADDENGLTIGAMCPIVKLHDLALPDSWTSAPLIPLCCRALLASFKIWNEATVGGNICRALPAGAMVTLACALDGEVELWPRNGEPRRIKVADLVVDDGIADLAPGELMRSLHIPASALKRRFEVRRAAYAEHGRSMIFLVATQDHDSGEIQFTVTASTVRPYIFRFDHMPNQEEVVGAIRTRIQPSDYLADCYRIPEYREHMTLYFARQLCEALSA